MPARPRFSPAAILAARVGLALAVLAVPAVVVEHRLAWRSTKQGSAIGALAVVSREEGR